MIWAWIWITKANSTSCAPSSTWCTIAAHEILSSSMCLQPIGLQQHVTCSFVVLLRIGMAEVSVRANLHCRIILWNSCLQTVVKEFLEGHSGAIAEIYDVASVFTSVLDHPTEFGFKNSNDWGDENCVWNDALHPTSKMHQIIAEEFVKVIRTAICPQIRHRQSKEG